MSVISPPPLRKFKSSIMYSVTTFPERAWKRALYNGTMIVKVYVLYNMLKVPHILSPPIFRTA